MTFIEFLHHLLLFRFAPFIIGNPDIKKDQCINVSIGSTSCSYGGHFLLAISQHLWIVQYHTCANKMKTRQRNQYLGDFQSGKTQRFRYVDDTLYMTYHAKRFSTKSLYFFFETSCIFFTFVTPSFHRKDILWFDLTSISSFFLTLFFTCPSNPLIFVNMRFLGLSLRFFQPMIRTSFVCSAFFDQFIVQGVFGCSSIYQVLVKFCGCIKFPVGKLSSIPRNSKYSDEVYDYRSRISFLQMRRLLMFCIKILPFPSSPQNDQPSLRNIHHQDCITQSISSYIHQKKSSAEVHPRFYLPVPGGTAKTQFIHPKCCI